MKNTDVIVIRQNQSLKRRWLSKYDELVTGLQTVTTAESFDDYYNYGLRIASNPRAKISDIGWKSVLKRHEEIKIPILAKSIKKVRRKWELVNLEQLRENIHKNHWRSRAENTINDYDEERKLDPKLDQSQKRLEFQKTKQRLLMNRS